MNDTTKAVREAVLDAIETALAYQLNAIRALRKRDRGGTLHPKKAVSQPEMAFDVLRKARKALHVNEIIARVEREHGVKLERESLVSALTKKVMQHDRFVRTDKNCFGLLEGI
jgi:hypothetical protein